MLVGCTFMNALCVALPYIHIYIYIRICIYMCIVATHLNTIVEPYEGCAVGAEPKDDIWWTYPEDEWMDPDVHDRRQMLAK